MSDQDPDRLPSADGERYSDIPERFTAVAFMNAVQIVDTHFDNQVVGAVQPYVAGVIVEALNGVCHQFFPEEQLPGFYDLIEETQDFEEAQTFLNLGSKDFLARHYAFADEDDG